MMWFCSECRSNRRERELQVRLDTIHENLKLIDKTSHETVIKYVQEQAHHCLESLHANESSLETRISTFFGITATALSALVGVVVFHGGEPKLSDSQLYAAISGGALLFITAIVFLKAMRPRHDYEMKGCTPHSTLSVKKLIQQNSEDFIHSTFENFERQIATINRQNRRLARYINCGTCFLLSAPLIAILTFFTVS